MTMALSADVPQFTAPAPDPNLDVINQRAQNQSIADIQTQEKIDSASLLARYGTRLSLANTAAGSPLIAPGV